MSRPPKNRQRFQRLRPANRRSDRRLVEDAAEDELEDWMTASGEAPALR